MVSECESSPECRSRGSFRSSKALKKSRRALESDSKTQLRLFRSPRSMLPSCKSPLLS